MQPKDYLLNIPNPAQDVMGSVGNALSLKSMMEQRDMNKQTHSQNMQMGQMKQQEFERQVEASKASAARQAQERAAAQARAAKVSKTINYVVNNPNLSGQDLTKILAQMPEVGASLTRAQGMVTDLQKNDMINTSLQAEALFSAGKDEEALALFDEKVTAAEEAGDDKKAAFLKSTRLALGASGDKATAILKILRVGIGGADKYNENIKAQSEADVKMLKKSPYKVLSVDDKKHLGLDNNLPFQIAPDGKISQIGSKGVTVNVGGKGNEPQFGTIPKGFMMKKDDNGTWTMEAVKGSPEYNKAKTLAKKKVKQSTLEKRAGDVVIEDIDRLKDKIENSGSLVPMFGVAGAVASLIPGTDRVDAEQLAKTVTANIGFDRLQQMREASPTGGALGAVSERELSTLQAVLGNLEFSQSQDQLMSNLDRLDKIYKDILDKAAQYPNAEEFGFVSTSEIAEENQIVETRTAPDGRVLVKYSDGTIGVK